MLPSITRLLLCLSAAAACSLPAVQAVDFAPGDWLERLNMLTPGELDPEYKRQAYEQLGTQWAGAISLGAWHAARTDTGSHNRPYATADLLLIQRLVQDDRNGGTWLRAAATAKFGLNRTARRATGLGECSVESAAEEWNHKDCNNGITGLSLMQYLNGKRTCIIAGDVNVGHHMDFLCTAGGYSYGSLSGSSVLPLPSGNLGLLLQQELGRNDFAQLAISRTGCKPTRHQSPFHSRSCDGFDIVGEYGRWVGESTELRLSPFYRHLERRTAHGRARDSGGVVCSIDADLNDFFSIFARAGFAFRQQDGTAAELTCGLNFYPFADNAEDFAGLGIGVVKGEPPYGRGGGEGRNGQDHRREYVAELMYHFRINDYCCFSPHAECIIHPAYAATPAECVVGAQLIFAF